MVTSFPTKNALVSSCLWTAMLRVMKVTPTLPWCIAAAPSTTSTPTASSEACRMSDGCQVSPQPLFAQRPMRRGHSCVHILAATNDTSSCPTCKCTAGNTQARSPTSVTLPTVDEGSPGQTSSRDTSEDTQGLNRSSARRVRESSRGLTTLRPTPGLIQARSHSTADGPTVRRSLPGLMSWFVTTTCTRGT